MLLTVFGATGQVGKRIVRYALAKGHSVRAFGRNVDDLIDEDIANNKLEAIKGSVFDGDEVLNAITGADAVLSALGGSFNGFDKTRSLGMKNIAAQMQKAGVVRVIAIGGMGLLNDSDGNLIMENPEYPAEYLPVGNEHLQAYEYVKDTNLQWTFVCPPTIKDEDATDKYVVSETVLPEPNRNEITAGDLAHFMVKEAKEGKHINKRVGISAV